MCINDLRDVLMVCCNDLGMSCCFVVMAYGVPVLFVAILT